jgi:CheY-like chemotaxis protein
MLEREPVLQGAMILVVDDDWDVAWSTAQLVETFGCTATVVPNPEKALQHLDAQEPVDLIITDIVMPGMSGIEFARRVRITHPNVPIVFSTGRDSAMEAVLDEGAVAILKPFEPDVLRRVMVERLQQRN